VVIDIPVALPAPHETFRHPIQKPPSGKLAVQRTAMSAYGYEEPTRGAASHDSNTLSYGN
jgi:hypothetical protein